MPSPGMYQMNVWGAWLEPLAVPPADESEDDGA